MFAHEGGWQTHMTGDSDVMACARHIPPIPKRQAVNLSVNAVTAVSRIINLIY